jgi:MerR family transcriptional regulator, light-induced transcriptional regulator
MTSGEKEGGMANRPVHPIGVVSARTGLTPDVIRVWERRYGVVDPARDEAGRRVYSDADVERLRLLAMATASGRGIGQVAGLALSDLRDVVRGDELERWGAGRGTPVGEGEADGVVDRSLEHTRSLDGPALESELRRAATVLGLAGFLEGVVGPLFRRIGEEWHAGRLSVAQEHLASGVAGSVLSRLAVELDGPAGAPVLVVATPAGEHHEIGALMVWAVASAEGWRVAYLGPNVPSSDIVDAARATEARCVALSVVLANGGDAASKVAAVRAGLPAGVDVLVGGVASAAVNSLEGVRWMENLASLREYLRPGGPRR